MELKTMRASNSVVSGRKKGSVSSDIFDKCRTFTRPGDLQAAGLYMYFEVFGDREGCGPGEVRMGNRKVLMFGSNDYLDLITHPKVKEASIQAIKKTSRSFSRYCDRVPDRNDQGPTRLRLQCRLHSHGATATSPPAKSLNVHKRRFPSGCLRPTLNPIGLAARTQKVV